MALLSSMARGLLVVWLVTTWATDIDTPLDIGGHRLVRRQIRQRRNDRVTDTVVAQVQPHGDVVPPNQAEHNDDGKSEGGATAEPSRLAEVNGAGEVRKPLMKRVAKSRSHSRASGRWLHSVVDTLRKLPSMTEFNGKDNSLMRMAARADGDTERIVNANEDDFVNLDDALDDVELLSDSPNQHVGKVDTEHKFRGCYALPTESNLSSNLHDLACMTSLSTYMPCRGGLPFYRLPMADGQSYLDCFTFCLSKGLDLFGIVKLEKNKECRCGATVANAGAWYRQQPKKHLLLPSKKLRADDPNCSLLVWEYVGGLTVDDSVPYPLLQVGEADMRYMRSIVMGRDVTQDKMDEDDHDDNITDISITGDSVQGNASLLKTSGVCTDAPECAGWKRQGSFKTLCSQLESRRTKCPSACGICTKSGGFLNAEFVWRHCYPRTCGDGKPWPKSRNGKVYINYFFENADNTRKDVFRKATQEFSQRTCIHWVEKSASVRPPRFRVGFLKAGECSSTLGYPGRAGTGNLNMGWCDAMDEVGSVIHEIGHAVGMSHEQNRPDGSKRGTIDGVSKGPHLRMYWQNVPGSYHKQYLPRGNAYVGSAYDGKGDPHWGYASYDFESVMHYMRGNNYDTIPSTYNSVVGQRKGLSAGDVRQIEDMYQCRKVGGSPRRRTSACKDREPQKCLGWRGGGHQCSEAFMKYYCVRTCGLCSGGGTPRRRTSACKDREPQKCLGWRRGGHQCSAAFMKYYCVRTCGLCSGGGTPCKDREPQKCLGWRGGGHQCSEAFMKYYCVRTCGLCSFLVITGTSGNASAPSQIESSASGSHTSIDGEPDSTLTNDDSSLPEVPKNGTVDANGPEDEVDGSPPVESVDAYNQEDDDVAFWVADAWGACKEDDEWVAKTCLRRREVVCESPDGNEITEDKCDLSLKPKSKQECHCSEVTEMPEACAQPDTSFGNKKCSAWRGLDCLSVDTTGELANKCPHICGLC